MTSKKTHHRRRLAANLGFVVTFVGALVMAGWLFDIAILKSILPQWVTMKFTTALSFFCSGMVLFYSARELEKPGHFHQVVLSISVLIILLLMGILFASTLLGMRSGIEDLFVKEAADAVLTTMPGRPSVGTMLNFLLISAGGISVLLNNRLTQSILGWLGWAIAVIGAMALLGYISGAPVLYFTIEGISTAMALHTALLFVLTGAGFILCADGVSGDDR